MRGIKQVLARLERACELFEQHAETQDAELFGAGYAQVLLARGEARAAARGLVAVDGALEEETKP